MLLASTARAATLPDPTPAENGFFGSAVTLAGGNLLVGAPFDDTAASDAGAAYLLDPATGALVTTLLEPAPAASDQFGAAVAAVGSDLLVGAPHFNSGAAHAGAVFVFQSGGGVRTLTKPTPAFDDLFGFALAAAGDTVVVGAPFDASGAPGAGAAYLFDARTGALVQTLANPTPADYDLFGDPVAAAGAITVVGAPFDDTPTPASPTSSTPRRAWSSQPSRTQRPPRATSSAPRSPRTATSWSSARGSTTPPPRTPVPSTCSPTRSSPPRRPRPPRRSRPRHPPRVRRARPRHRAPRRPSWAAPPPRRRQRPRR